MAIALTELIARAREQLKAMTGLELASTVSVRKDDSQAGQWRLRVEVVERKSLPDSQDLLATYDLATDAAGQVLDFNRVGMRRRMEPAAVGADEGNQP